MTPTPSPSDPTFAARRLPFIERLGSRLQRPGSHWVWLSIVMYAMACALPAMPPFLGDKPIPGYACLIWLVYWYPPWWANPAYFIAVIASLLNRPRVAVVFSVIAALLAVSYELMGFYDHGVRQTIEEALLPGCLFWITSLQLLACNELWRQWLDWQQRVHDHERGPADFPGAT